VMRKLVSCTTLILVILGLVDAAPAGRSHSGVHRKRITSPERVVTASRTRLRAPALGEFLVLPQRGRLNHYGDSDAFGLRAASAILMDANSGAVLYERSPDETRPPASVTKIITALVILEHGQLTDAVTVSATAAGTGGYRLGLRAGQRISLGDLLTAILIRSANDAAVAAAEHVGGSLAGFVALMNEKAAEIGMTNSRFSTPHGLDEPFHYTTARDMATLTRVALDNPTFAEVVRTRQARVTIWKPGRRNFLPQPRIVQSHNRLLGQLEGADGVKTGYTDSAGRCLVASASRGSSRLIAVLLNDPRRWTDAAMLLEYGFGAVKNAARVQPDGLPWQSEHTEGRSQLEAQARVEERP
jgi:D-alanyl-D-alanine carboxypeptidase